MTDASVVEEELRRAITRSLVPLQTIRRVDTEAFEELERLVRVVALQVKSQESVPK